MIQGVNMYNNSKVAKSIRLALMLGAGTAAAISAPAFAAEEVTADDEVEKIQITGSRIRRADMEGALPVTVIDRAAIEFSGQHLLRIYFVTLLSIQLVHFVHSLVHLHKVFLH